MKYQKEMNQYLKSYPASLKWINECPACHHRGYKPNMPEHVGDEFSIMADHIRKFFVPMEIDDMGFCMTCSRLQKS